MRKTFILILILCFSASIALFADPETDHPATGDIVQSTHATGDILSNTRATGDILSNAPATGDIVQSTRSSDELINSAKETDLAVSIVRSSGETANYGKEENLKTSNTRATGETIDFGEREGFTITTDRTPSISESAPVTTYVITSDDISAFHYESTADAVSSVSAAVLNSNGSLGAIQNANVNGMGSGRTIVCINGANVSTAYDNNFDLNLIPVSAIERIEILTSGAGRDGRKVAAGGVVNIITKKAERTSGSSFEVSFENGSFLPAEKGFIALLDSQNLNFTYTAKAGDQNILISGGGMRAGNNYSYKAKDFNVNKLTLRENADTWAADLVINADGPISFSGNSKKDASDSGIRYSTRNFARYMHSAIPGGYSAYGPVLTKKNYQNNLILSTVNTLSVNNLNLHLSYNYIPVLVYHDEDAATEDSHFKHALEFKTDAIFAPSDNFSITPFVSASADIARSTSLSETKTRFYPKAGFNSALTFNRFAIYPMFDIGYVSDMEKAFPNASLSAEFAVLNGLTLSTGVTYAHRLPTFSDLYWPFTDYGWGFTYKGNPNLKPEKALSGDIGLQYITDFKDKKGSFKASFDVFTRWVNDLILTSADYSTMENLDNALYIGFNTNADITVRSLKISASWMFNKSFNLTDGLSVSDDIRVSLVRLHTVNAKLSYTLKNVTLFSEIKYLGRYYDANGKKYSGAFIWNGGVNFKALSNLDVFVKLDNILNTQYQLVYGYPMPGLKIHVGGNWKMK